MLTLSLRLSLTSISSDGTACPASMRETCWWVTPSSSASSCWVSSRAVRRTRTLLATGTPARFGTAGSPQSTVTIVGDISSDVRVAAVIKPDQSPLCGLGPTTPIDDKDSDPGTNDQARTSGSAALRRTKSRRRWLRIECPSSLPISRKPSLRASLVGSVAGALDEDRKWRHDLA